MRPVGAGREDDQSGVKEGRRAGATGTRRWAAWTIRESCAERRNPNAARTATTAPAPVAIPVGSEVSVPSGSGRRRCLVDRCRGLVRSLGRPVARAADGRRRAGLGDRRADARGLGRRGHPVDRRRRCRRRSRPRCSGDRRGATGAAPGSGARGPATAVRPRRRGPRGRGRGRGGAPRCHRPAGAPARSARPVGPGPRSGAARPWSRAARPATTGAAAVRTVSVTARTGCTVRSTPATGPTGPSGRVGGLAAQDQQEDGEAQGDQELGGERAMRAALELRFCGLLRHQ